MYKNYSFNSCNIAHLYCQWHFLVTGSNSVNFTYASGCTTRNFESRLWSPWLTICCLVHASFNLLMGVQLIFSEVIFPAHVSGIVMFEGTEQFVCVCMYVCVCVMSCSTSFLYLVWMAVFFFFYVVYPISLEGASFCPWQLADRICS